jgi:hypothetical protein
MNKRAKIVEMNFLIVVHLLEKQFAQRCKPRTHPLQPEAWPTSPHPDIQVIHGACPHLHKDLARTRSRIRNVAVMHHMKLTVLREIERFHVLSASFPLQVMV